MSLPATLNECVSIDVEYWVNRELPRAATSWISVDAIDVPAPGTAADRFTGARLRQVEAPNWPQSFARRGLRFTDYLLLDDLTVEATSTTPAYRRCEFVPLAGGRVEKFKWNLGCAASSPGDVVITRREELQIPARRVHKIGLLMPSGRAGAAFKTPVYTADFKTVEALAEFYIKPPVGDFFDSLRIAWCTQSLVRIRRHASPSLIR